MARLKYTFLALDPSDEAGLATWTIGLEPQQMERLLHSEHETRLARLRIAQEVAQQPTLVFEGWEREGHEDGLCYVGRPEHDFRSTTIEVPPPPGMVFLVFVKPSGKMTDWRWENAEDVNEPLYPEDWKNRFGRIVWPTK